MTVDVNKPLTGQQIERLLIEVAVAADRPAWSEPGKRNLQMHRALVGAGHDRDGETVCKAGVVGHEFEAARWNDC